MCADANFCLVFRLMVLSESSNTPMTLNTSATRLMLQKSTVLKWSFWQFILLKTEAHIHLSQHAITFSFCPSSLSTPAQRFLDYSALMKETMPWNSRGEERSDATLSFRKSFAIFIWTKNSTNEWPGLHYWSTEMSRGWLIKALLIALPLRAS